MKKLSTAKRVLRTEGVAGVASAFKVRYVDKWIGWQHNRLYGRLVELMGNVARIDGCTFSLDTPPVPTALKSSFLIDRYELPEREAIRRFLDPALPVVEFGAALGVVSCLTNRRLSESRRHVVVEANPALLPLLKKNRDLNGCGFQILHRAVGYDGATVRFYAHANYLSSSATPDDEASAIEVEAVTLRSIIDERGFGRCTLICDIEGGEADLLRHEADVLKERVATLILELHPAALGRDRAAALLAEVAGLGFREVFSMSDTYVFQAH